ncbi:MAG: RecX family transcriptional regulator [Bacteroidetes bacterium]|nr:RecX family transcriptional regulator [Bacteroidota bacterium]
MLQKQEKPKPVNGIITAIDTQSARTGRVSVFIDGSFFCGLNAATAARMRLKPGRPVDEAFCVVLLSAAEQDSALNLALASLSRASQPADRIRKKLVLRGFSEQTAASIISRLREEGYLNDDEYARKFVMDAIRLKKWGMIRIKKELSKKGIQPDSIQKAVDLQPETGTDEIVRVVLKKFGQQPDTVRVTRFLQYRGYSWEEINRIIRVVRKTSNDQQLPDGEDFP